MNSPLPCLTKTLSDSDYPLLAPELHLVDTIGIEGQHERRRWEYAMALKALATWKVLDPERAKSTAGAIDVGGAGSNLNQMLSRAWNDNPCMVVDPAVNTSAAEAAAAGFSSYVVTCVSVLEHVEDEWEFLSALDKLVRPGGMLFLTMDCGDSSQTTDTAHYHWMRTRLYTPETWSELAKRFVDSGWEFLGDFDFSYNGHTVLDYSFASLSLRKKA